MDLVVFKESNFTKTQHVNRKSSDELLRKFADPDVDESKSTKRRRKSVETNSQENEVDIEGSSSSTAGLVERKRLLFAPASKQRFLLRQLASGKSHLRNKSLVRTIGKTWRKTMEGASRVFIEKHYNRHRRLINDVV